MSTDRHPDNGVPGVCVNAAEVVAAVATDLAANRTRCDLSGRLRSEGNWQGASANAFTTSLDAITASSVHIVSSWERVVTALRDYASGLAALQVEGDQARDALAAAEEAQSRATRVLKTRKERMDEPFRILDAQRDLDERTGDVTTQVVALGQLRARRTRLDQDTARALRTALGPGADQWQTIAYRNGRKVSTTDIVDELLDLLDTDPAGNLDLLRQFLLAHSDDAETLAEFYEKLGPSGLLGLMRAAGDSHAMLFPLIDAALAKASSAWNPKQQEDFGAGLVEAIDPDVNPSYAFDSTRIAEMLSTPGLQPHIGLGVVIGLDRVRVNDPERFARIVEVPAHDLHGMNEYRPTMANVAFHLMSEIPTDSRDYFLHRAPEDSLEYWYGDHPWGYDGFTGPAALLRAIITDPTITAHDADDTGWGDSLKFLSRAIEALGGNPDLAAVAGPAARDLGIALEVALPEIAASLDSSNAGALQVTALIDGSLVDALPFTASFGSLARVLGVVLQDPQALTSFAKRLAEHLDSCLSLKADPRTAADLGAQAVEVGSLYGLVYGALSAEERRRLREADASARATIAKFEEILWAIPAVKTGKPAVDFAIEVGRYFAPDILTAIIKDARTPEQIDAASRAIREQAASALAELSREHLVDLGLPPDTVDEVLDKVSAAFDKDANAASNDNPSGSYATERARP